MISFVKKICMFRYVTNFQCPFMPKGLAEDGAVSAINEIKMLKKPNPNWENVLTPLEYTFQLLLNLGANSNAYSGLYLYVLLLTFTELEVVTYVM